MATATMPAIAAPSTTLLDLDPATFRDGFGRRPFVVRHHLADHPLFALPRLVELARRLPAPSVEYNAGDLPVNMDPRRTPQTGLSVEETIERVENCRSWMVLKNVEQDPDYGALLHRCLGEVEGSGHPLIRDVTLREGFIFISSPGSVTPYHMDPEHNFLLQVRGAKQVSMFDGDDRGLLSEEELERFYSGAHRNMVFKDEYQQQAAVFALQPGDGLHFPVTWPHWVKNGDAVSISFSITFMTRATERRAAVYAVNHYLRMRGLAPAPIGRSAWRDAAKYNALRVARRLRRLFGQKAEG